MKKLYMALSVALLMSSVAFAQVQPADTTAKAPANRPTKEEVMAKRRANLTEELSKLPKDKLQKQKQGIEKRLMTETDPKKKEYFEMRLHVINSLLQ